jgi:hypothetical protein
LCSRVHANAPLGDPERSARLLRPEVPDPEGARALRHVFW